MKVSVIIPVYNGETTIAECITALLHQSVKPHILVVDDGSKDATALIVKQFARKHKRVQYIHQKNKGPATARNVGAKKAKTSIVIFTDADCIADKNMVKELLSPFEDKEVVGVQGRYKTKQQSFTAQFTQLEIEYRYERMKNAKSIDWIGSYCCAYRKKDFLEEKGFDTSFSTASGEDPELSFKMHEKGKQLVFNEKAFCYHYHPETLAQYLKIKFFRAYWRVLLYKKHAKKMVKDSYTPQWLKLQIFLMYALIPLAGASWFLEGAMELFQGVFLLFIISTLPFVSYAMKNNKSIGMASMGVLFLRAIAFATGLIAGLTARK